MPPFSVEALSDADQALTPAQFAELAARVRALVSYMEEQGSAEGGRP